MGRGRVSHVYARGLPVNVFLNGFSLPKSRARLFGHRGGGEGRSEGFVGFVRFSPPSHRPPMAPGITGVRNNGMRSSAVRRMSSIIPPTDPADFRSNRRRRRARGDRGQPSCGVRATTTRDRGGGSVCGRLAFFSFSLRPPPLPVASRHYRHSSSYTSCRARTVKTSSSSSSSSDGLYFIF